jgi:hypothetical protein
MTCVADGPTSPPVPFSRNNYAALILTPKVRPVLTDSNEIVLGFEVDNHFSGRRWLEISVYDADEELIYPNKTFDWNSLHPTGDHGGQVFHWMITSTRSTATVLVPGAGDDKRRTYQSVVPVDTWEARWPATYRRVWDEKSPIGRNEPIDGPWLGHLDLRAPFELVLTATGATLREGDVVCGGSFDVPLPPGRKKISITHELYHSSLEENENRQYAQRETYWIEHTNDRDLRHWDNAYVKVRPRG